MNWLWVSLEVALAAHLEQLAEHGGGEGVRDSGMLESAMARPQKLVADGNPDAADLAASSPLASRATTPLPTATSAPPRSSVKPF